MGNVLRLGDEVTYRVLVREGRGAREVERGGVVVLLDRHLVWCAPEPGTPTHRADPVPYSWVRRQ